MAIYKHTTGKVPGNLLMIGNSGTGKTTIMNNIQRLYNEVPEYQPFRAVTIINANLLVDGDAQQVFVADADQIPAILREIGRLRPGEYELRTFVHDRSQP